MLVVAGYRRIGRPDLATEHPLRAGGAGIRAGAARQRRRSRRCGFYRLPATLPLAPGGAIGDLIGNGLAPLRRLQRRDAAAARAVRGRLVALLRHVVAAPDGAHRRRARARRSAGLRRRAEEREDRKLGEQALGGARGDRRCPSTRRARASRCWSCRRWSRCRSRSAWSSEKQRPLFQELPDSPLPPLALLDDPPAQPGDRQRRNARVHVAADRAQARRLRRRGEGAGRLPGPGDHALRDRARRRRQGRADRQPGQGPRARAVGGQHPRGRDDSRQVVHGPRAAEPQAPDRQADRDPLVDDVQRQREPADAGAGQGHRRQAGDRRPRADAAPAGRRHHRLGQVGRRQRDDPVAAVQGRAAAGAPGAGRPQDAGAVGLRGHSAPARAGRHRHEARRQRAQLVRGRDGAPLQADVVAGRAQPRRLQRTRSPRRRRPASRSATRSR